MIIPDGCAGNRQAVVSDRHCDLGYCVLLAPFGLFGGEHETGRADNTGVLTQLGCDDRDFAKRRERTGCNVSLDP